MQLILQTQVMILKKSVNICALEGLSRAWQRAKMKLQAVLRVLHVLRAPRYQESASLQRDPSCYNLVMKD